VRVQILTHPHASSSGLYSRVRRNIWLFMRELVRSVLPPFDTDLLVTLIG
jgi:hypothetical protein